MLSRSQRIKYWIVMPLSRLIFTPPLHLESNTSRRTRTGPRQPCVLMYLCMSWRNGPAWNVSPLGKQGLALACYLLCHNGHSVPGVCRCSLYIFGVNGWISVFCPVGTGKAVSESHMGSVLTGDRAWQEVLCEGVTGPLGYIIKDPFAMRVQSSHWAHTSAQA
jgi:hypothetical protein